MSRADAELQQLRLAHRTAFLDAGERAASLDLQAPGPLRLDRLRFQIAHDHFFASQARGQALQQYRDHIRHREMKQFELGAVCQLEAAGLLNLQRGRPAPGPAIYCSHHLGAWAVQHVLLRHRGIPLALVAGADGAQAPGGTWRQMRRALQAGRSLYVCLDGQRGRRGSPDEARHEATLRFAGREVVARMEVACLAHRLGLPLVSMLSWREADGRVSVEIGDPIPPEGEREDFARRALQQLWHRFEALARQHASQWEMGWYCFRMQAQQRRTSAFEPRHPDRFDALRHPHGAPAPGLTPEAGADRPGPSRTQDIESRLTLGDDPPEAPGPSRQLEPTT